MNPGMNYFHVKQEVQQKPPESTMKPNPEEELQRELLARDTRLRVWFRMRYNVDSI